jgi:hypothetical protein
MVYNPKKDLFFPASFGTKAIFSSADNPNHFIIPIDTGGIEWMKLKQDLQN